jgi:hypothetical protein
MFKKISGPAKSVGIEKLGYCIMRNGFSNVFTVAQSRRL